MKFLTNIAPVLRIVIGVVVPSLLVVGVVYAAGSLTAPSGTPSATSYTLDDIYTRLTTNAASTAGNHSLSTTTSPSASFRSLTEIYDAIPTISASKVVTGTTYLGVAGTIFRNLFNGTCNNDDYYSVCNAFTATPGGSQANGGVDDFNGFFLGGTPPSDRYSTPWTTCTLGNSYCGTNDSGAYVRDDATGLVWSYPCSGSGCSSWDTEINSATLTEDCLIEDCAYHTTDMKYSWDTGGANNNGRTAPQLCSDKTGWSLPHQKQLLQSYINGSYGNVEPQGVYRYYWSSTKVSFGRNGFTQYAWVINLSNGYSYDNRISDTHSIRCVR